jgi:hypothetical protein
MRVTYRNKLWLFTFSLTAARASHHALLHAWSWGVTAEDAVNQILTTPVGLGWFISGAENHLDLPLRVKVPFFTEPFISHLWRSWDDTLDIKTFDIVTNYEGVSEHHTHTVLHRVCQEFAYVNAKFWFDYHFVQHEDLLGGRHRIRATPHYDWCKCPAHLWIPDSLSSRKRTVRIQTNTPTEEHDLPDPAGRIIQWDRQEMSHCQSKVKIYEKY